MKDLSLIWILALGLIATRMLSGCGPLTMGNESAPYYIESYNMDGTKLIVNGLKNQNEPSTYDQDQYTLKTGQRLLTRFEGLAAKVDDIKNSWDDELHLRIIPTNSDAETLKQSVKLCPLTRNWMMLATWYKAHPFNKSGIWNNPGADYDAGSCITGGVQMPDGTNPDATPTPSPAPSPTLRSDSNSGRPSASSSSGGTLPFGRTASALSPSPSPASSGWSRYRHQDDSGPHPSPTPYQPGLVDRPSVIFDIKPWFLSNPEGRNVNFGFILISDRAVEIFGDHSSAYSPRIYWKKAKTVYAGCTPQSPYYPFPYPKNGHCPDQTP